MPQTPSRAAREGRTSLALLIAGAAILVFVALALLPIPWGTVWRAVVSRWWAVALGALGLAAVGLGVVRVESRRRLIRQWPFRALPWWFAALALATIGIVGLTAVSLLLSVADEVSIGQRPELRIEAIKTGLAVAAGTVGVMALMLAMRRQWDTERSHSHDEFDAAERRATELYVKAVEELGSDKAPVRLGGLYALERLAQGAPQHRQTVVEVICAYLRMSPPSHSLGVSPSQSTQAGAGSGLQADDYSRSAPDQEHQVRITAQRILGRHLRPDSESDFHSGEESGSLDPRTTFWPGMRIDLVAADLTDLDLSNARMGDADFTQAVLRGRTCFDRAIFYGRSMFWRTRFEGQASFESARFHEEAYFAKATFESYGAFADAVFSKEAAFTGVTIAGHARFIDARFDRHAVFADSRFGRDANFNDATFSGVADFSEARFAALAEFIGASFENAHNFEGAVYEGEVFGNEEGIPRPSRESGAQTTADDSA